MTDHMANEKYYNGKIATVNPMNSTSILIQENSDSEIIQLHVMG